ncbi:hypothetical protein [Aquabacterium sp.]|uniref:hypothetical protein n=1 Tax=Aquabacterium sp. TaxID=1872578 RepID=UPI00378400B1
MAQSASTDTVYRCGPDGRSYSSTPCASGKPVAVADPRSEAQQQAARDTAQRERQLADRMTAERVQREKSIVPAAAGNLGPHTPAPKASAPKSAKPKKKHGKHRPSADPMTR